MRSIHVRLLVAATAATVLAAVPMAGVSAARPARVRSLAPADYIAAADQLSKPKFRQTTRQVFELPAFDGETLYIQVVRPDPAVHGRGPWPVILEASPYHGTLADRDGTRIFPDPVDQDGTRLGLTGYFAPRGYAVAMFDLRGTGRSSGCLDHLGQKDARDLETVIEWLASRKWSNGRVGMTGHSYVGSTPSVAAAQAPDGLVTIVPSAGLASMYEHQFQRGVPYLLQWAGPMFAYESLAMDRDLPPGATDPVSGAPTGDNFENAPNAQFGCGWQNSSLTAGSGQVTGEYQLWHAQRDWRRGATRADIPVFMIHGVNDNAARIPAAEWFFGRRFARPGDKVWIGQWDHGSTNGRCGDLEGNRVSHPTCRFDQFKYALHAWFDKHLKQRNVSTGPAVEVFLNGKSPVDVTQVVDPETLGGKVFATDGWRRYPTVGLYPDASNMSLGFTPPADEASATFGTVAEAVLEGVGRGSVTFRSEPVTANTLFVGLPELQLNASLSTGQITHLTATLFRERVVTNKDGEEIVQREPMNVCAIQPQLRFGVHDVAPVIPGEEMELPLQCFTMAHWVPAGQRLALEISTRTPHHATFGSNDQDITVYTGPEKTEYGLPVVSGATLFNDVPLREVYPPEPDPIPVGPAQPGASGSVFVPAPGVGVFVEPVTAVGFEFDIQDGFDNASLEAVATPATPADIDLYLQRQLEDGTWSDEITSGASGELTHERLTAGRQEPGRYRILVHNWAGGPTDVELQITFFNQNGEPGPSGGSAQAASGLLVRAHGIGGLMQP
jgi:predicted acyl esterase